MTTGLAWTTMIFSSGRSFDGVADESAEMSRSSFDVDNLLSSDVELPSVSSLLGTGGGGDADRRAVFTGVLDEGS